MSHNVEGSTYAITCTITTIFRCCVGNDLTVNLLVAGGSPTIVEVLRTEEVVKRATCGNALYALQAEGV